MNSFNAGIYPELAFQSFPDQNLLRKHNILILKGKVMITEYKTVHANPVITRKKRAPMIQTPSHRPLSLAAFDWPFQIALSEKEMEPGVGMRGAGIFPGRL